MEKDSHMEAESVEPASMQGDPVRRVAPPSMIYTVGVAVCLLLLATYVLAWLPALQGKGGLEAIARTTDFVATATGARLIRDGYGPHLYDLQTQRDIQRQVLAPYIEQGNLTLSYVHPPWEALLVAPLADLPVSVLFLLWDALMVLAFIVSLILMQRAVPLRAKILFLAVLAFVTYQPLDRALMQGQSSELLLLGIVGVFYSVGRESDIGIALSLLLVVQKPQILPIVLLLVLFERRWQALVWFAGMLAFLAALAAIWLGPAWPLAYLSLLNSVQDSSTAGINPEIMHNIRGLSINSVGLISPALVTAVTVLLSVALLLLLGLSAWWAAGRKPAGTSAPQPGKSPYVRRLLWALAIIIALLVSPHLYPHDLVVLIFPAWLIIDYALAARTSDDPPPSNKQRFVWASVLLWGCYLVVPLTFYLEVGDSPALTVVPSVILLLCTVAWLTSQLFSITAKTQQPT